MVDRGWRFLAGSAKVWREKLRRVECGFNGFDDQAKKVEIFYCCQVPQEEEGGIWFRRESGK